MVNTVQGPRADNLTYLLDLKQIRCQSDTIGSSTAFGQKSWDVSPSTNALTVALQDIRAGTNSQISATKFKSYEAGATPVASQELGIVRFFVNYAGQNLPAPDADPEFKAGTDYTVQRYTESAIYSGAYYDSGGAESLDEWHNRGAYYYQAWPKDATDRSTRVNVHLGFEGGTDVSQTRILLFDHSNQTARIQITNGQTTSVDLQDM